MPTSQLAVAQQQAGSAPTATARGGQQAPVKPFCQASKPGIRLVGSYIPVVSTAPAPIGPVTLTASGGYVKRWILETIMSGGGATTPGVLQPDGPWNYFSLVTASEPNNNPVLNLTGLNLYLADVYGGYSMGSSPISDPDFTASGSNPAFWPYIPLELDPTGLGALSDLSSSSGYQLYILPNPSATVWSTVPSSVPTVALNVYAEFWTLPDRSDGRGAQQAIVPPRAGTIQMWNQILNIVLAAGGGNQELQLNRMGNRLRTILMVTRTATVRSDAVFPTSPARIEWDDIILYGGSPQVFRKRMFEKTLSQTARPNGVHALFFNEGITRFAGGNGASAWLATVTDTRFALQGNFPSATTPTLDWVVNDVSRAPLGAVERTTVGPGGPGYHPALPTESAPS